MSRYSALIFAAVVTFSSIAIPSSYAEAMLTSAQVTELTKQAEQDNLKAQMELARRYFGGEGVKQDYALAAKWYQTLADKEVADAQLTIGLMYIRGNGVAKDDQKAIQWLTRAAEHRIPTAQYLLGVAHAEGHGVEPNNINAYMWYEIAAALEYPDAITARDSLAKTMANSDIQKAEKMATDWWMKFHH